VNCRRWCTKRGFVILLGAGGAREETAVFMESLLDGGPLMCGSVVAVEGDGTVDGGRWRSAAWSLLR
jgi:hypothetical protein